MAKHRIRKYSRRTRSQYKKSRAPIVLSVIAFLLLSLIISVVVGILLSNRVQNIGESPKRFDFQKPEYILGDKKISSVEAYNFPKGASAQSYIAQDINDLSVCVRHKDGRIDYSLEAAENLKLDDVDAALSFSSLCEEAHRSGGRVCAYVYIGSFEIEDRYLREIKTAYEIALINEIAVSGADDILLLGINITGENISEVEAFLVRASIAAEKTPLGISVSEELLDQTENEIYLASRVKNSCDYLALDLTHLVIGDGESNGVDGNGERLPSTLEKTLEENEYYIKSYSLRVLFSKEHSRLYIPALELGVTDLQIVGE